MEERGWKMEKSGRRKVDRIRNRVNREKVKK